CALAFVALPLGAWAPRPALAGGRQTMSATGGDVARPEITNARVPAPFQRPEPYRGDYRGTRFDASGDTYSLRFAGHEFTGPWFESYDPLRHDALMGPVEEFLSGDSSPCHAEAEVG